MQSELKDLQPKLEQSNIETDALIARIETETVEVEAVKEVVSKDEAIANEAASSAQAIKVRLHYVLKQCSKMKLYNQTVNVGLKGNSGVKTILY